MPSKSPNLIYVFADQLGYATPTFGKDTHIRNDGRVSLVKHPEKLSLGSRVGQELDFYGGAVKYRVAVPGPKHGTRAIIKLLEVGRRHK